MADSGVDRDAVEVLADILDEKGLTEVEYEADGIRVRVTRAGTPALQVPVQTLAGPATAVAATPPAASPASGEGDAQETREIRSPMVGTFYEAASPDAEPYVRVGDRVRKGQVVCIIEAMKLMNEIESEFDGVIAESLAENSHGVEFDEPLFRVAVD